MILLWTVVFIQGLALVLTGLTVRGLMNRVDLLNYEIGEIKGCQKPSFSASYKAAPPPPT